MRLKNIIAASLLGSLLIAGPSYAQDSTTYSFDGSFEDAAFGVESAIIGRGLVIDWVSHVGEMLERTRADVGSDVVIFDNADVFMFCSASLSRKVMEADPANVAYCPYAIFVTDHEGTVNVGYRNLPDGVMQEVQILLDDIAQEATQ